LFAELGNGAPNCLRCGGPTAVPYSDQVPQQSGRRLVAEHQAGTPISEPIKAAMTVVKARNRRFGDPDPRTLDFRRGQERGLRDPIARPIWNDRSRALSEGANPSIQARIPEFSQ
jgi:hypothetical protein